MIIIGNEKVEVKFNKKTFSHLFEKSDLSHSGIAKRCEFLRIPPEILSQMTDITEERLGDLVKAKDVPTVIEAEKISKALCCSIDNLCDDRWSNVDKKYKLYNKEREEMEDTYERFFHDSGSYLDCMFVSFVPHSLLAQIKDSDFVWKYLGYRLLDVVGASTTNKKLKRSSLFVDTRDYKALLVAIKSDFVLHYLSKEEFRTEPSADVSVYLYDAKAKKIEKEILVFHGKRTHYEGYETYKPDFEVLEMWDLFPQFFKDNGERKRMTVYAKTVDDLLKIPLEFPQLISDVDFTSKETKNERN